ncbi:fibronectin type III domain-containing protein [Flavobacteriaceae bacterium]|nr:fibronectin type III domain-containing protein [Flavobacteriaceae bacterium]
MKKNILPIVFLFLFAFSASSQVVIGTDTPAPSSIFHLESTDKGFLPPRMTEAQMNAIQNSVEGLIIYCLDCPSKGFKYFDGVNWTSLTADPAPTVTVDIEQDGFTGTFVEGIELNDQTLSVTVTNASFSSAALSFDTSNISFTGGVTGITVSAVSPTTATLAQAGDLQKVTYTLEGTPVGFGTLTAELNIAGILTGSTTVTVVSASDFVLAQIGNEADDPDSTPSAVTTEQLALITPALTNVVDDNEAAYQAYIDNNPTLFDSPATPVQVQAMVDLVNASQTVLVQIGLEADDPDTVNAVVTTDQLGLILPSVTNIEANNETAYQDYIDNNPSLFTSPATQPEVQAMVDAVNASQEILAQIGLEADSPDNVPSAVTTDELGQIIPTVTGIVSNNQAAYQNYIDSNPSLFDSPATQVQVQNMINQVNANQSLLANIGTDASNGNNALTSAVTAADLNALPTISGAVQANEARYLQFIRENRPGFSSPATTAEVQAMIDLANAVAPGAPTNVTATLGAIEGTAFDVNDLSPALWLDAADASTITETGGKVSQWDDKSGNNNHLSQSNSSYQPQYNPTQLNGQGGVDFHQNKKLFSSDTPTIKYVITVIEAQSATWTGFHSMLDGRSGRIGGLRQKDQTGFHNQPLAKWEDGVINTDNIFNSIDNPHIIGYTPTSNASPISGGLTVGSYDSTNSGGNATQYEIIALSSEPSQEDRQKLEGYLAHKWGLTANLPQTHPYKETAPGKTGQADVTFTAPASDGGSPITSYEVTSSPGGITGTLSGASGGTVNIKGLAIGTAYTFTVTASNAVYTSESSVASSPAITPITITDAPTIGTATTLSDSEISVAFTPPSNGGGSPITSYTVTSSPGGYTATGPASPLVVSGLNGGTGYTFTVTATNAAGTSDASGSSNQATTDTRISDAPSIGTATAGYEQATITFSAPAHDGGAAITTYVATSSPGGIRGTVSGPGSGEITVTGLTNGEDYTFTVTAVNENGTSAPSSASNSVTPNVAVGDLLQGGVVYYVAPTPTDLDGDGKVDIGLICAVEDQSAAIDWILGGLTQSTANGNTLEAIGTGQSNSTAMMNQAGYTGGAAQVAEDYSVTDNGVTYNDWFLPSLEELNEMYSQKNSIEAAAGVTPFGTDYWSSSEHNSSKAKSVNMSSGNDSNTNKSSQYSVRAIRTFSGGTGLSDPDTGFD